MIKNQLLRLFNKFLNHEAVQSTLTKTIHRNVVVVKNVKNLKNPYFDHNPNKNKTCERDDIIFITSRFRSGSTVFWNLFRQMEGFTAYYEPFNERQWFNPDIRGRGVDKTHKGVDTYWDEYDGLEELEKYYDEDWIRQDLLLSEESWQPKMKKYIEKLIENTKGRPVLQFNRIDFRLPWIKKNFPNAKLVHLYRNPRDQWCSFLTNKKLMNKHDVEDNYEDNFYLNVWCNDLKRFFPFLSPAETPHPYRRFYYLWKLSYNHGVKNSDISIAYEDFANSFDIEAENLSNILQINKSLLNSAHNVVNEATLDKWKSYANDDWFKQHELYCENMLNNSQLSEGILK